MLYEVITVDAAPRAVAQVHAHHPNGQAVGVGDRAEVADGDGAVEVAVEQRTGEDREVPPGQSYNFV